MSVSVLRSQAKADGAFISNTVGYLNPVWYNFRVYSHQFTAVADLGAGSTRWSMPVTVSINIGDKIRFAGISGGEPYPGTQVGTVTAINPAVSIDVTGINFRGTTTGHATNLSVFRNLGLETRLTNDSGQVISKAVSSWFPKPNLTLIVDVSSELRSIFYSDITEFTLFPTLISIPGNGRFKLEYREVFWDTANVKTASAWTAIAETATGIPGRRQIQEVNGNNYLTEVLKSFAGSASINVANPSFIGSLAPWLTSNLKVNPGSAPVGDTIWDNDAASFRLQWTGLKLQAGIDGNANWEFVSGDDFFRNLVFAESPFSSFYDGWVSKTALYGGVHWVRSADPLGSPGSVSNNFGVGNSAVIMGWLQGYRKGDSANTHLVRLVGNCTSAQTIQMLVHGHDPDGNPEATVQILNTVAIPAGAFDVEISGTVNPALWPATPFYGNLGFRVLGAVAPGVITFTNIHSLFWSKMVYQAIAMPAGARTLSFEIPVPAGEAIKLEVYAFDTLGAPEDKLLTVSNITGPALNAAVNLPNPRAFLGFVWGTSKKYNVAGPPLSMYANIGYMGFVEAGSSAASPGKFITRFKTPYIWGTTPRPLSFTMDVNSVTNFPQGVSFLESWYDKSHNLLNTFTVNYGPIAASFYSHLVDPAHGNPGSLYASVVAFRTGFPTDYVSEFKTLKIRPVCSPSVLIQWQNDYGGLDQWAFLFRQDINIDSMGSKSITERYDPNIEVSHGNLYRDFIDSQYKITLMDDQVMNSDLIHLDSLKRSKNVRVLFPNGTYIFVIPVAGATEGNTRDRYGRYTVQVQLPRNFNPIILDESLSATVPARNSELIPDVPVNRYNPNQVI